MLPFTAQDTVAVLKKSGNLNAALKNFLKKELKAGDPASRFVKDLRELVDSPNTARLELYIQNSKDKFPAHLIGIGRYAHLEASGKIVETIIEKYAEDFNKTYEEIGETIKVTDKKKFDEIVKQALTTIDTGAKECGFADSAYFKNIVLQSTFNPPVLAVIFPK